MTSSNSTAEAWNIRLIGHSDLNGYGDGMQLMLKGAYLLVGHLKSMGTSILDVSDPRSPRVVKQMKNPPGTHTHKVQIAGDILLINYEQHGTGVPERVGFQILDISDPAEPKELGFFATTGRGVHRMWYTGGDYVYVSATLEGYTDRILMIVEISDPTKPREVSRWWLPGMWTAGGEEPAWPPELRVGAHHPIVLGNRAYMGFWDAGLFIMDISDLAAPKLISRAAWAPEAGGHTHTALPLPNRDLLVVTDEATEPECQGPPTRVRVFDINDETQPRLLSMFPEPRGDFCKRGLRFGPHNLHENRPDSLISGRVMYVTYCNAGLRVVDISQPEAPKEIAYYIPRTPEGQKAIQTNDVFVAGNGLIYISDRVLGGVDILELTL